MRRFRFAAFLLLGGCVLLLGPILASALTQLTEKPTPLPPQSRQPEKARDESKRDRSKPRPDRDPPKITPPVGKAVPKQPMPWFTELDKDGDNRISPLEWRGGGRNADQFREYDLNGDGFITPDEFLHDANATELRLRKDRVEYHGNLKEKAGVSYKGKRAFQSLTIPFDKGKTYQIDLTCKLFQSFLYLESADGSVLKETTSQSGNARITHRADRAGVHRIVVTSFWPGPFSCTVTVVHPPTANLPKALASLVKDLDKDEDGQIGLYEWQKSGKKAPEFRRLDRNRDGLLTPEELLRDVKDIPELKFHKGRADHNGEIETREERYRGKSAFKLLIVKLERGKSYQIDLTSKMFQSFLYLEDADGNVLKEHSSPTIGGNSRITHRADKAGVHRIVVTSLGGFRTGPYSCSVSVQDSAPSNLPKGLMPWFSELDRDKDGQIGLYEWQKAGKKVAVFRELDLNGDGFLTPEELRRYVKQLGK